MGRGCDISRRFEAELLTSREDIYKRWSCFQGAYQNAERVKLPETADKILSDEALVEVRRGFPEVSRRTLDRIHPADSEVRTMPNFEQNWVICLLRKHSSPRTIVHRLIRSPYVDLPRVRAVLALEHG
jgi:hypothetical protein